MAGRFTLIDHIGSGGSGSVWRAYDQRERRYCAAKLVRPADTRALLRAVREQAFRLAHPHLLTPYSWAAEDDDVLLALDLVRGGSLETLVNDYGRLPTAFAATILDQLLAALDQVHSAGVVHRDVKPANVLLDPSGTGPPHARLTDFGIAVGADGVRLTSTGYVVGTRGYVAPEVLAGRESGPSQDLYAAGRVAQRMLAGTLAPDLNSRPPDVPAPLWSLVDDLCAERPADRPSSAAEARRRLAECGLVLQLPARTEDGDPVEVFDQTGPLPAGWGPDGPEPIQPLPDPAVRQAPAAAPPPAEPPSTATLPDPKPLPTATLPDPGPEPPATVPPPRPDAPPTVPAVVQPRRATRRRLAVVAGAAGAVLLGAAGGVLAYVTSRPDTGPDDGGGASPSQAVSTGSGAADPARPPLPGVSPGGPCQWQDVSTTERLPDGRWVRCEFENGTYRWRLTS